LTFGRIGDERWGIRRTRAPRLDPPDDLDDFDRRMTAPKGQAIYRCPHWTHFS
jgi:hypothetical protein